MIEQMWEWVQAQPDPVRAGIYAAAVAIAAVIVNNLVALFGLSISSAVTVWKMRTELQHDREKTAQQLTHNRQQTEAQRKLDLRRDTYMGLAEHLLAGINSITAWADLGRGYADIVPVRQAASKYSAQIHLMAQPPLVAAVGRCNNAIDAAILRIRVKREQVAREEHRMQQLRKRIDSHRALAASALERLRTQGLSQPLPEAEFERLRNIAEQEEKQAAPLAVAHDDILLRKLPVLKFELHADAVDEERAIYPLVKDVVAAARAELGEEIDMTVYDELLATAADTDRSEVRKLFGLPEQDEDRKQPPQPGAEGQ